MYEIAGPERHDEHRDVERDAARDLAEARRALESELTALRGFLDDVLARHPVSPRKCEYRFLDARGEVRWVRTTVARTPRSVRAGNVSGLHLDITEARRARDTLTGVDERYQFALRVAGVSLWERSAAQEEGWMPASITALAGFGSSTRVTWTEWLERIHPRDRQRVLEHASRGYGPVSALREHDEPLSRIEYRVRHVDGTTRWLETTIATVQRAGESAPVVFGTVADITDRVRERTARRTAERLHRDVWESIPSSTAVVDRSGVIVEVNPALKDHPETVNSKPHETWMVRLRLSDSNATGSLLDSTAYEKLISAS